MKALFVGLNTIDLQFFVDGFPNENTKTKVKRNEISPGGPALNAAITCSFLGVPGTLLTPIGFHSLTRFIIDDIINHGVELIDPIHKIESKPIFASIITNEINGERTVFSYHPEEQHSMLMEELNLGNLSKYDIALFDGFYPELSSAVAKELKNSKVTTVLDGGSWKPGLERVLPYIDIAICSSDFKTPGTLSIYDTIQTLFGYGIEKVAITRGEESVLTFEKSGNDQVDVPKIKAIDTLGAGDIFHGAFCYYYSIQPNFKQALLHASKVAAASCKYHGTRSWMKEYRKSF